MSSLNTRSIAIIAGARPNFMKVAPILRALAGRPSISSTLIHTGQHYDPKLSDIFFEELQIKAPDVRLTISGSRHGEQTAEIIRQLEPVFAAGDNDGRAFDLVLVVGDVNSTMAATLTAAKLHIPVAHVEAGLRSFDRRMPEEINRLVTDSISDVLLASEPAAIDNLKAEGHPNDRIFLVGNVMIDTLLHSLPVAQSLPTLSELNLNPADYATVTLHRPSNVDDPRALASLVAVLRDVSRSLPIVFPLHPRTKARLDAFQLMEVLNSSPGVRLIEPLSYMNFLCLNSQARVIITDSGGLQEESTALGIPCLTMRDTTERPVTVTQGTSTLIGSDHERLHVELNSILQGTYKRGTCPELWDGRAAERIADVLIERLAAA